MNDDGSAVRSFAERDRDAVVALWHVVGLVRPWNDPDRDIDRKLEIGDDLLLVLTAPAPDASTGPGLGQGPEAEQVIGTIMVGYEGHRGWLNYLAVDPARRGQGLGRRLVGEAERRLADLGCPKVNLMVRADNEGALAFYRSLGYSVDEVTAMGKRLIADE